MLLEAKLNTYIAAIESGEVLRQFAAVVGKPEAERRIVVAVRLLHTPSAIGLNFFERVNVILEAASIGFDVRIGLGDEIRMKQRSLCARFGVRPNYPKLWEKVGISRDWSPTGYPLNGLRNRPGSGTCGWYLWSGCELSDDPNYFMPLHFAHLKSRSDSVLAYMALPQGWRFLQAPGYEDVWYDENVDQE